jgi:alanine dehydrogenase
MRGKDRCPIIVSTTMVEHMKKGAVIVDVSISQFGGRFETLRNNDARKPTLYKKITYSLLRGAKYSFPIFKKRHLYPSAT